MPLDFSDLTGKKKTITPPKPIQPPQQQAQQKNAQGFYSPDKIPKEEKKQPTEGMGYPVQQT